MKEKFIAYYRVSTQKQGKSGLGLEAQRQIVSVYCRSKGKVVAQYTEVESGKKSNRMQLAKAVEQCKATNATLIVAKLDRLSRDVLFIFQLMDSKVKFVCADIPQMNTLTVGIFAVMAQHERELISSRTRQALAAKKAQGFQLGKNNLTKTGVKKSVQTRRQKAISNINNRQATIHIKTFLTQGNSYSSIAKKLNEIGLSSSGGKKFTSCTVSRLAKMFDLSR